MNSVPQQDESKYCTMTTINMLVACRESYSKTLNRLEKHSEGLTNKYYDSCDIPPDIMAEVSDTNKQIAECIDIINNIKLAIDVIQAEL